MTRKSIFDDPGYVEWINQLREIPMEDIADHYGIEREGMSIICPEHADKNIGSCKIHHNRYYCFACHAKGDNIRLVQTHQRLSFMDAARELANAFGYPVYEPWKHGKNTKIVDYMPITKKQLTVLGLLPGRTPTFMAEKYQTWKEDGMEAKADPGDDNTGYVLGNTVMMSPERLYREDKESFFALIAGKFRESSMAYLTLYQSQSWESELLPDHAKMDFKNYLEDCLTVLDELAKNMTDHKLLDLSYFKLPEFQKQTSRYRLQL